ncbi:MAG: hypothetical protein QM751_03970 [Paludibacteraceae bacterium]
MKTIRLFLAVCVLTALCGLTRLQAQTNLLFNPGFETVTDGVPADWTLDDPSNGSGAVTFASATSPVYAGSKSLKLTSTDYLDVVAYQYIPVTVGKQYNMSIWYNIESYEEEYGAYASFGYQFTDANGTNVGSPKADYINEDRTKNTWREFKHTNITAPTGAVYLKVLFFTQYHIVAYFDNASVTEAGSSGINEVRAQLPIRVQDGNLIVSTEARKTVEVYSVVGTKLQSKVADGDETVISGLPKGQVLIVRSGNAVAKVVL